MEASGFTKLKNDEEQRALDGLLDAFSSVFSVEEISSAYRKARNNAVDAGAMLYDLQQSTSSCSSFATNNTTRSGKSSEPSSEMSYRENGNVKAFKTRMRPASIGTVSTVIGKSYMRPIPSENRKIETAKPLKLDQKDLPMSELWGNGLNSEKDDRMRMDVEDFLLKILGDGFKLDGDMIKEVLGSCGYDMEKSMKKLLDLSAMTLDKRDNFRCKTTKKTNVIQKLTEPKGGSDSQNDVLTSLFNVPKWSEESSESTSPVIAFNGSKPFGQLVVQPLRDTPAEHKTDTINQHHENKDGEDDSYEVLRKAVMEYRATTKEYYKSAVEAFVKGDQVRANKLLEQGLFFQTKAREADEESEKMIFGTSDEETQETMSLDLHDQDPKDAVRTLKCHLSSLSGIASMMSLKVIIERNGQDTSKGARKRLTMRLLEKESIKWTEEGNTGTILIRLDEINRKHLSFASKK